MAFFTKLPPELLYAIIESLDLPALASLHDALRDIPFTSTVCAIISQKATNQLYAWILTGLPKIQFAIRHYTSLPRNIILPWIKPPILGWNTLAVASTHRYTNSYTLR